MTVFSLNHGRSRELYDLTMLEVRRVLYDSLPARLPIAAARLLGTRAAWIARYAPLMNAAEFTKFYTLTRDLGPFVVFLVDSENCSRRQDRNPAIGRRNIEWTLGGHPDATQLF